MTFDKSLKLLRASQERALSEEVQTKNEEAREAVNEFAVGFASAYRLLRSSFSLLRLIERDRRAVAQSPRGLRGAALAAEQAPLERRKRAQIEPTRE